MDHFDSLSYRTCRQDIPKATLKVSYAGAPEITTRVIYGKASELHLRIFIRCLLMSNELCASILIGAEDEELFDADLNIIMTHRVLFSLTWLSRARCTSYLI